MSDQGGKSIDPRVRHFVYDQVINVGLIPTIAQTAEGLGLTDTEIYQSFRRLAEGRVLVLQGDGEILMANPFSAVPTPFLVEVNERSWWGNCIWDALGIAAFFKAEARVRTACPDCGDALELHTSGERLQQGKGLVHIAVPAKHWWDNIVFS